MVKMLNTYFYKGGEETLIPAIESLIDTRQLETYEHAAPGETRKHPSGERVPGSKGNARWFGVSMNDKGCLAKESDVKSATIKDLGNDRYQIDIIVADCRNPKTIKEGAATAPNPIAAFMEVQDISVVFDILNNAIARNAAKLVGVDLKNSSYMQYSGSSCKLVYNAKTMECESLHQIGKFSMTLDGSIKGIDCSGKKVKISAFYDYTKFQWNTAYKA